MSHEHYDVAVIGGGQAGLPIGHHLARAGVRFTILDAARRAGRGLALALGLAAAVHPARHDSLPGLAVPRRPRPLPDAR